MTDFLGDQDGNEVTDQDSNPIEIVPLNYLRISKLGSDPRRFLELPEINLSWFDLAYKSFVDDSITDLNKVTFADSDSYDIQTTDKTILVSYTAIDTVTLQLPSANTFWDGVRQAGERILIKDTGCNAFFKNIYINAASNEIIIDSKKEQATTIIDSNGGAIWLQAISSTQWVVY